MRHICSTYGTLRGALGLLLLAAAALKAHQLGTQPVAGDSLFTSRAFLIIWIEVEILLGLLLLSGLCPRLTWLAAAGCFVVFTGVSLGKAIGGESSCGCFGVVEVNPWYVLILDVAALALLIAFRPNFDHPPQVSRRRLRMAAVLTVALAGGLPAALAAALYQPAGLAEDGGIIGDARFVVLEPETWEGKRFPLMRHIDVADMLASGRWTVVLYHHDCPHCQERLPEFERQAREEGRLRGFSSMAMLELPPYAPTGRSLVPADTSCLTGRVSDVRDWFVETPTVVMLKDGIVVSGSEAEVIASAPKEAQAAARLSAPRVTEVPAPQVAAAAPPSPPAVPKAADASPPSPPAIPGVAVADPAKPAATGSGQPEVGGKGVAVASGSAKGLPAGPQDTRPVVVAVPPQPQPPPAAPTAAQPPSPPAAPTAAPQSPPARPAEPQKAGPVTTAEYHFGFVDPKSTVKATVTLENHSQKPFVIKAIRSECKCMTGAVAQKTIAPGSPVALEVVLEVPDKPMYYSERILLQTDDPAQPNLIARIKADVGMALAAEPSPLDLGAAAPGDRREGSVTVRNRGQVPARLIYSTATRPGCFAKVPREPVPPLGTLNLPIVVTAGAAGPQNTTIQISTDLAAQPALSVPVKLVVGTVAGSTEGQARTGSVAKGPAPVALMNSSETGGNSKQAEIRSNSKPSSSLR